MAQNPPGGTQRVIPMLVYSDAPAAIEFLCKAFGFEERYRLEMDDGRIGHAEIGVQDNVVMLASVYPELGMASPQDLPAYHSQRGRRSASGLGSQQVFAAAPSHELGVHERRRLPERGKRRLRWLRTRRVSLGGPHSGRGVKSRRGACLPGSLDILHEIVNYYHNH